LLEGQATHAPTLWVILQPGYDFGSEFEFGLGVILDALARSIPATAVQVKVTPGQKITGGGKLTQHAVLPVNFVPLTREE